MSTSVKPRGLVLGLVGNLLIAVALNHLLQLDSCGDVGMDRCPDGTGLYVAMVPIGIFVSIAAVFLGGGIFTFSGIFIAVGLGSMSAAAVSDGDMPGSFGWWFGGIFAVCGIAPLALAAAARPMAARKAERMQRLVAKGGRGIGTVVGVRDTGITINDDPRVELTMRIQPDGGGPPFERSKTITASRVAIPRAGDRFPVWFDPADPETWAFGTDVEPSAPADVRDLFARAAQPHVAFNPPVPAATAPSPLDELAKLNQLRMAGALSDEEFQAAKDRLLAQLGGSGAT